MTAMPDCAAGAVSSWMNFRYPYALPSSFQLTSDAELNCRILANAGDADVLAVHSQ
ncbi:MAG: hypothetical protein WAL59_20740 [Roseiarcus sp.]